MIIYLISTNKKVTENEYRDKNKSVKMAVSRYTLTAMRMVKGNMSHCICTLSQR